MAVDKTYIIPFEGLGVGEYSYTYELDRAFFDAVEYIDFSAEVRVDLSLIKQASLMEFHFYITGKVFTDCDRCLRDIALPIEEEYTLIVKRGENEDTGEIVYIGEDEQEIDISHYLVEFTGLSIPMTHVCADTELKECPEKVRKLLDKEQEEPRESPEKKLKVWDALKDLTFNKED